MKKILTLSLLLSIAFLANGQGKAIHYKDLQKHLPSEILGFISEDEPEGNMFEMNELSYSSASRSYSMGGSYLEITIMDYTNAAAMYQTSTMAWAGNMSYEDDEQKASSITVDGVPGWYTYNKVGKEAQLLLGYKDRYLISITHSETDDEDTVKEIAKKLNLTSLP